MNARTATQERMRKEMVALTAKVWSSYPLNTPIKLGDQVIADKTGVTREFIQRARSLWTGLGAMTMERRWVAQGQEAWWTLLLPEEAVEKAINQHYDSGKSTEHFAHAAVAKSTNGRLKVSKIAPDLASKVALTESDQEETKAIAGPEPGIPFESLRSLRRNDAEALLESARQYANREQAVRSKLAELEALGIGIDYEQALRGIQFKADPVLEAVSGLVPYVDRVIDRLNKANNELGAWRDEAKALRQDVEPLRQENQRLKDANKRLSERNAALVVNRT